MNWGQVVIFAPALTPGAEQQLHSLVARAGFTMGQFTLTRNAIPPGTKVIIALGNAALQILTGEDGIMRWRGRVVPGPGAWVVPTFDPAFLLPKRGEESSSKFVLVMIQDLRKAVAVAREGFERTPVTYLRDPEPTRAMDFAAEYEAFNATYLCPDIETTGKMRKGDEDELEDLDFTIQRVGYAFRPHYAMSIPWLGPWMDVHRRLLESPGAKTTWNGKLFDEPVLVANGMGLHGDHHDAMWCLESKMKVAVWGQRKGITIKELVTRRLQVPLVGMDESGARIPVKIVGWHATPAPGQRWVRIKTDQSRCPIVCTPDHRVWTRDGWKDAGDIQPGEFIAAYGQGADDAIEGMSLGDGYISPGGMLSLRHGQAQTAYCAAKARYLGIPLKVYAKPNEPHCHTTVGRRFRTRCYTPEGAKRWVPPSMRGWALWFMDDGHLRRNTGAQGLGAAFFCCERYAAQQDEIIGALRSVFGSQIGTQSRRGKFAIISLHKDTASRFFAAIAPWVHPSMDYKLPEAFRGQYNGWLDRAEPRWAQVTEVTAPKAQTEAVRYCVTVDHPTHRFFLLGGLVSNCWHTYMPNLPKKLEFVSSFCTDMLPWKHTAKADFAGYNCADVDSNLQIMLWLERTMRAQVAA